VLVSIPGILSSNDKRRPEKPCYKIKNHHAFSVRIEVRSWSLETGDGMTTLDATTTRAPRAIPGVKARPGWELPLVYLVVGLPVVGLVVGIVLATRYGGISPADAALALAFYLVTAFGVTVGFHRLFTHQSFKTGRALKTGFAIAGMMALEGGVITWVADHRRHHAFADAEGDPHSPWRYGRSPLGLLRGLWWAHTGWLFAKEKSSARRWAPDLVADADLLRLNKLFPVVAVASLGLPALLGYAIAGTAAGAFTAFVWAGLVRILVVHHITWSVNSLCHVIGERPFETKDEASNVNWLALVSLGESWHNLHHADPKCARHGVERGQLDPSAGLIRLLERARLAWDVRWPTEQRLARIRKPA
jgi:stearoyl-CoA desaturase (delta-9 desaturase)